MGDAPRLYWRRGASRFRWEVLRHLGLHHAYHYDMITTAIFFGNAGEKFGNWRLKFVCVRRIISTV